MGGGVAAGGSFQLAELIDQYGEHLVPDLKRYYGVELADVLVEGSGLTPRKVLLYIRALPADSATVAAMRGGLEFYGWDLDVYMLANLLDAIRENTYVTMMAAGPKKKPKPPEPFQRPGSEKKKQQNVFVSMARAAYLKGMKDAGN